ncbi:MAG TPA: mechanosensitive ion channel domain-containing protein [Rhizobiaceae bacterium]|nr:mechanosensitive ion channel domain-containing protein [Rhizobiaceae bacterium]
MDLTGDPVAAIEAGVNAASALLISYSFSVIGAIVLLIAGYLLAGVVERSIFTGLGKVRGFDLTLRRFFSQVARYTVIALVIVMVLGQFGVQTASIIAALGAIGLAVGLALQSTLQNIAAGIMLLVLRPLRVGEYVEVGAITGTVEEIGLFATQLRSADGIFIFAPNSKLWNEPVRNFDRNGLRRNEITVTIAPESDVEAARKVLKDLAEKDDRVLKQPAPAVAVAQAGASSVTLALAYWTRPGDFAAAKTAIASRMRSALNDEGVPLA